KPKDIVVVVDSELPVKEVSHDQVKQRNENKRNVPVASLGHGQGGDRPEQFKYKQVDGRKQERYQENEHKETNVVFRPHRFQRHGKHQHQGSAQVSAHQQRMKQYGNNAGQQI